MQIFDYLNKEGLLHLIRKIMGRDVDLTQAEYDALPESKNSDGKNYYIYDSDIAVTAEEVGFDGSASGSTAANSQQALNELFAADKKTNESLENVNSNLIIESVEFIPSFSVYKVGHTIEIYKKLSDLGNATYIELGITQYKPVNDYAIIPVYSTSSPYLVIGSLWIYNSGNIRLYKQSETTECYISGSYIFK